MARKRMKDAPALKSWEDADAALKEIAELEITLDDIEGELNKQIAGAKESAAVEAKPHHDRIAKLEKDLKEFTEEHGGDLCGKKTKKLNFGSVGFRQSTTISIPKAKEKADEIIRKLRARKPFDCIIVKETVNKDVLRQYGKETVIEVGAGWKQAEVFWYEPERIKLEVGGEA